MRPLNTLATAAFALIAVLALGACGKKKTSSAASTPASQACVYNATYGSYTIAGTTTPCVPGQSTTTTCPAAPNNFYTNHLGQVQTCTPGQQIPNTGGYNYGGQYPYPNYMNQTGCDQWTYQYGIQYVPVVLQGTLQCVRIDVLAGSSYGTNYGNNYDYYYYAPPYSDNSCSTMIDFGGSWGNLGICF